MALSLPKKLIRVVMVLMGALALLAACLWQLPHWIPVRHLSEVVPPETIALVGVTVYNPGEIPHAGQTVLIKNSRIVAVQNADLPVPAEFAQVQAAGQWLMPGLIDLHVHVFDETDLTLLLAHGVTTARNMMGKPFHLALRNAISSGQIAGPRLFTAGPTLNNAGAPLHKVVEDPATARTAVQQIKAQGYDFIKIYDGLTADVLDAIVTEARHQQLRVAGHPPKTVDLQQSATLLDSVEHAEELWQHGVRLQNSAHLAALAEKFKTHQTMLVPTLQIVQQLSEVCGAGESAVTQRDSVLLNPVVAYLGRQSVAGWADGNEGCEQFARQVDEMAQLTKQLLQAGVLLGLGSDSGPHLSLAGAATLREVHALINIGISSDDVLKIATSNAALMLGQSQHLGRIDRGYLADALLLQGDPRSDIAVIDNPVLVIANGRVFDANRRNNILADSQNHAGWLLTIGRLLAQ